MKTSEVFAEAVETVATTLSDQDDDACFYTNLPDTPGRQAVRERYRQRARAVVRALAEGGFLAATEG